MMKIRAIVLAVCGGLVLAGCASQKAEPTKPEAGTTASVQPVAPIYLAEQPAAATQPALPEGHPPLPQGHPPIPQQQQQPALPEGHPQIPQQGAQQPALPEGHPQIPSGGGMGGMPPGMGGGGMGGMGQMPEGHPDIGKMQAATTQPTVFGTLIVKAKQGTAGAPAVSGEAVAVELYNNGTFVKKLDARLGADGVAKVADVPFGGVYQQVVRLTHGGVEYAAGVEPLEPGKNEQTVEVPVYETTEQAPAWSVKMRHVIVQPTEQGVQVMEVVAVDNPTDKAWIGQADKEGTRTTFSLDLPETAKEVQVIGGFEEGTAHLHGRTITNHAAITPGLTKYQVAYLLPVKDGNATLTASAPAPVKMMMVIVPDDGTQVTAEGLEGPNTVDMGKGKTRYFSAGNIPAGKQVKLVIAGNAHLQTKGAAAGDSAGSDTAQLARIIAGAGGLLIFIVGGAFLFLRAPKKAKMA